MASTRDTSHIRDNQFVEAFNFAPGVDTAVDVSWQETKKFNSFLFQYKRTVGTGAVDTLQVIGNTVADGSGTDVVIKTSSLQPDAVDDVVSIEVSADEIQAEAETQGADLLGISLQVEHATASDEGVVAYVFGRAHNPGENLTADVIS